MFPLVWGNSPLPSPQFHPKMTDKRIRSILKRFWSCAIPNLGPQRTGAWVCTHRSLWLGALLGSWGMGVTQVGFFPKVGPQPHRNRSPLCVPEHSHWQHGTCLAPTCVTRGRYGSAISQGQIYRK